MFRVTYFDKDGTGFCKGKEPWFLDEFESEDEANDEKDRLISEGYQNVNVVPVTAEEIEQENS